MNVHEDMRQDALLADYCKSRPSWAGVRLQMLLYGDDLMRDQARRSILRDVPNLLRDYSGTRGPRPFTDCPAWLFPLGTRGNAFTHWHAPDGSLQCR
jgi:hypothetical protein